VLVTDESNVSLEYWKKNTDREKLKYSVSNLFHCCPDHKSHME